MVQPVRRRHARHPHARVELAEPASWAATAVRHSAALPASLRGKHTCHGFNGPNLTTSVDSDCPALDTPRFVSPFPNVSAGPGIRDVRYCAGMHAQEGDLNLTENILNILN